MDVAENVLLICQTCVLLTSMPTMKEEGHMFLNELFLTTKDLPNTHKPTGPCVTSQGEVF